MIAIVPARGGSKGLPGKNIKLFCGKPLIYYTITEALKASKISEVIISTDSVEIAEVTVSYGAKCPFMRPSELAVDYAKAIDNYIYTIKKLNKQFNYDVDEFVVLQPTSPLRTANDIDNSIEIFGNKNADSVISVTEFSHPLEWAKKIDNEGRLKNFLGENLITNLNRQELSPAFVPNGAIFIFKLDLLLKNYSYYSDKTYAYKMDPQNSVDIDSPLDFEIAEFLMRKRNG